MNDSIFKCHENDNQLLVDEVIFLRKQNKEMLQALLGLNMQLLDLKGSMTYLITKDQLEQVTSLSEPDLVSYVVQSDQ